MNNKAISSHNFHRAFSLIEALVAISILSIGILAVMLAMSMSTRAASQSRKNETAINLAQRELALAIHTPNTTFGEITGQEGTFSWTITFQTKPHSLIMATIRVTWLQRGEQQLFELLRVFQPR